MIDKMQYIQQAALVKVREKKLLNHSRLIRMIEANTALDILKILSETDYSNSMVSVSKEQDYEQILSSELKKVYNFARELSKNNREIVDILALKYAFQDLKLKLKADILSKDVKFIDISDINLEKEYIKAKEIYEKTNDIQEAVIDLDKSYFKRLKELKDMIGEKITDSYYDLVLSSYNLLTFLRLKNQNRSYKYAEKCLIDAEELLKIYETSANYIDSLKKIYDDKKMWDEYLKTNKIADIEKHLENKIVNLITQYKNVNYGIEPIITYVLAKEFEIKAIRLIMTGKINKIPQDIIKERLRDIYV